MCAWTLAWAQRNNKFCLEPPEPGESYWGTCRAQGPLAFVSLPLIQAGRASPEFICFPSLLFHLSPATPQPEAHSRPLPASSGLSARDHTAAQMGQGRRASQSPGAQATKLTPRLGLHRLFTALSRG